MLHTSKASSFSKSRHHVAHERKSAKTPKNLSTANSSTHRPAQPRRKYKKIGSHHQVTNSHMPIAVDERSSSSNGDENLSSQHLQVSDDKYPIRENDRSRSQSYSRSESRSRSKSRSKKQKHRKQRKHHRNNHRHKRSSSTEFIKTQ